MSNGRTGIAAPLSSIVEPPFRRAFDAARDPLTARNALGIVSLGGGDVSAVPTPAAGELTRWTDATHIEGVTLAEAGIQPLDADLTSIAGYGGTGTWLYRSAADTWAAVIVGTGLSFAGGTLTATGSGNVSNSGTPTDNQLAVWTDATHIEGVDVYSLIGGFEHGKLRYSSATALTFTPFNGNKLVINGAVKIIPSGGIAGLANTGVYVDGVSGQNLAASTLYYIYAFDNSGIITADFSTTAHAISNTTGNVGVEIKSGDDTRSLIGMCRTNASSQFVSDAAQRLVRSWFNRDCAATQANFTALRTTTSTSFAELNSEIRNNALIWSDEIWLLSAQGAAAHNSTNNSVTTSIGIDSATPASDTPGSVASTGALASQWMPFGMSYHAMALSEGFHYATLVGKVGTAATTGNWRGTAAGDQCTLLGRVIAMRT